MGKKSGPAQPAAPDPVATANAQSAANREAAIAQANLNRVDQYTPQGSITWQQTGTNADGTPRYQSTQSYSPDEQAKYDQQNAIAMALGQLGINNIGRVQQAQSQPFSYDGMTPLQTGVVGNFRPLDYGSSPQQLQTQLGDAGQIRQSFNTGPGVSYMQDGAGGDIQRSFAGSSPLRTLDGSEGGNIQNNLDYSGVAAMSGVGDFGSEAQRVQNAVYSQAASRLDPQFQKFESDTRARLAAQGITENSDAYRRAMDDYSRSRADAYNQANFSSIQAGSAEQSRLFGLAMGARQQGVSEINNQGQFANNAQAQRFGQSLASADQFNNAQGQQFAQNQAQAQFGNNAQQQAYNQITQRLGINNAAAGQQYAQNQGEAAFWNSGQDQRFTQNLAAGEFGNNARSNMFQQGQQAAATNNTARAQDYNEAVSNLNINNQGRQQQIQEATYLRNLPLNEIAALLGTGGGVNNPMFSNVAQVGVASPDYQGAVYQNYNAAMQQYNQAQQARSQGLGSIFGLAGSLGSAAILSDRRLKENIKPVSADERGLMWYTFNYIGSKVKQFGVMAQEVLDVVPEAVLELPNGVLAVDYGKLR